MLRRASCALGLVTALAGCGGPTPEAAKHDVPLGPAPKEPCGPVQGPDTDGDALSDAEEARRGTDPKLADSDGDGKNDAQEACHYGTDPLRRDTDGDALADADEIQLGCDPLTADTDGGGATDGEEVSQGSDPSNPTDDGAVLDTDGDGLPDPYESAIGTDPTAADTDADGTPDGDEDADLDGLTNAVERAEGCDATLADSDGDSLDDYFERMFLSTSCRNTDTDGGGTDDGTEFYVNGTDPTNPRDD